jgi:metal-responsive CopG/Arc/MetJ family transcriptional regulator
MTTKAVQIVLDDKTLRVADREARRAKVNRSELFRRALAVYLEQIRMRELENRHRAGYAKHPERADEFGDFEGAWPER